MGDELKDFTKDELVILGEKEPESETETETETVGAVEEKVETEEAGKEAESAPAEEKPVIEAEPKKDKVQARIDELTAKSKTAEEKLDLFKRLGPEGYYKLHPDEAPETKAEPKEPAPVTDEIRDIRSNGIEGGDYNGKTFGEVFDKDPRAAYRIDPYYARKLDDHSREVESKKKSRFEKIRNEESDRIDRFAKSLSSELFQVDDIDKLDSEKSGQLESKINEVMDWMQKTGRLHYNIDDAYALMTAQKKITDAKVSGAKTALKKLESSVKSIHTGGDEKVVSEYDRYFSMSNDKFMSTINRLPDDKFNKLMKDAPKDLKQKFPQAAWDD